MSYFHRFHILFFFSSSLLSPLFSLSFILSFLTLLYGFILSVMVLSCIEPAWCVHIRLAMHLPLESNCYVVLSCIKPGWCVRIRLAMQLLLERNCYVSPWVVNKKLRKWFIACVLEAWYHCGAFKPDSTATLFQTLKTYYESISTGTETIQEVQCITFELISAVSVRE